MIKIKKFAVAEKDSFDIAFWGPNTNEYFLWPVVAWATVKGEDDTYDGSVLPLTILEGHITHTLNITGLCVLVKHGISDAEIRDILGMTDDVTGIFSEIPEETLVRRVKYILEVEHDRLTAASIANAYKILHNVDINWLSLDEIMRKHPDIFSVADGSHVWSLKGMDYNANV